MAQRVARQESSEERNRTFWTAFILSAGMGILGGVVLYFLGHWLFAEIFQIPNMLRNEAKNALPWLAAIVPLMAIISVLAGTLEARQAFLSLNASQTIGIIALQSFPLINVALGHSSIASLISAALLGRFTGVLAMFWFAAHSLPFQGRPTLHRNEIRPLLQFGGWVSASGAVSPLLAIIDRVYIGATIGVAAVTTYTVPLNLAQRFEYLPLAINTSVFPRFSNSFYESARRLMLESIRALVAIQTPLIILAILSTHTLLSIWVGATLAKPMTTVFIIMLIGIWINGPSYPSYAFLQATGHPDVIARFYLIQFVPFLLLLWYSIKQFGIYGAAFLWSLRKIVDAAAWFYASNSLQAFIKNITRSSPLILGAVILGECGINEHIYILLSALIFGLSVYFSVSIYEATKRTP